MMFNIPSNRKKQASQPPKNFLNREFYELLNSWNSPDRVVEKIFNLLAIKKTGIQPLNISYLMTQLIEIMDLQNLEKDPYFPLFNEAVTLAQQQTIFDPIALCSYLKLYCTINSFLNEKNYDEEIKKLMLIINKNIHKFDEKNFSLLMNTMASYSRSNNDFIFEDMLTVILNEIRHHPKNLSYRHLSEILVSLSRLSIVMKRSSSLQEITRILIGRTADEISDNNQFSQENLAQIFYSFHNLPIDYLSLKKEINTIIRHANNQYKLPLKNSYFHKDAAIKQMLKGLNALPDELFFGVHQTQILTNLINETNLLYQKNFSKFFTFPTELVFTDKNLTDLIKLFKETKIRFESKPIKHPKTQEMFILIQFLENAEKLNAKRKQSENSLVAPLPRTPSTPEFGSGKENSPPRPSSN